MTAVIFEAELSREQRQAYLDAAAELQTLLSEAPGFISIERFQSLSRPEKLLALSFWENEDCVKSWRTLEAHRAVQSAGRTRIFTDYRLRVSTVLRDYGMTSRKQAPEDSRVAHG